MNEAILNLESALDRLGGDKEFLLELLKELVEQIDLGFADLEKAVSLSDFDGLKKIAHGLKGAAANLNADSLAKRFSELEKMAFNSKLTSGTECLEGIRKDTEELKKVILTL